MELQLKDKCKKARQCLNMAQWEFAKIIGTNQTEISFIERGFIPDDARKTKKIEDLYDRCKS
jgi:DNA-binding XRE family transcriptional regulator